MGSNSFHLIRIRSRRATRLILAAVMCAGAIGLTGCGSSGYKGYKTKPYTIRGVRYHPIEPRQALDFRETGVASWYDEGGFLGIGRKDTALGEPYRAGAKAGAHKTLPIPCRVKVVNLENGRSTKIRINDRGPFIAGRTLDVTKGVAKDLGFEDSGLTRVSIEVLSVGDGKYKLK